MTLDPEAVQFLQQLQGAAPIWSQSISANRAAVGLLPGTPPHVAAIENTTLELSGRSIAVRTYAPENSTGSDPVLVFFHGGGWIMGSIDSHDHLARALCRDCRCTVVSVDYRLAPEHVYPAAADDAYAATRWAAEQFGKGRRLFVAGDSAGGNLAAVTSLLSRDRGGPKIDLQILIYPITDCSFDTASYREHGEGTNLTTRDMQYFWDQYCPDVSQRVRPTASPLQEFDLSRLPEAVVITAGHDPLCTEGEVYAQRLERAGTPVTLIRCEGMVHGFMRRVNMFAKAREVLTQLCDIVQRLDNQA